MGKYNGSGELNIVKVIVVVAIIIAIIAGIIIMATKKEETQTNEVITEQETQTTQEENEVTLEQEGEETVVNNEEQTQEQSNEQQTEEGVLTLTENQQKAIDLVKDYRNDDSVTYEIEKEDGNDFTVIARDTATTRIVMFYEVNISTGKVEEQ